MGENAAVTTGNAGPLRPPLELTDGPDLLLGCARAKDLVDIVRQCQDPETQRWTLVPVPYGEGDALRFVSQVAEGWRNGTRASFAILHEGRYAGSASLTMDGAGGAEVGYGLGPWARGKGVMSRALRLLLAWGFDELELDVVHWKARVGNWPSRRAATRCGFRVEGTVRGLVEQHGERHDGWIGSLLRGDPLTGEPDTDRS
jgi:RimJ/RimL family protein N-acetyltransferase